MALPTSSGLGALGASYPERTTIPDSQMVEWLNAPQWQENYDRRRQDWGQNGKTPELINIALNANAKNFDPLLAEPYLQQQFQNAAYQNIRAQNGGGAVSTTQAQLDAEMAKMLQQFGSRDEYFKKNNNTLWSGYTGPLSQSAAGVRWNPADFSALNAERDYMLPRIEQQKMQQSAYDWMSGKGTENGMLSADYQRPDFGSIYTPQMNPGSTAAYRPGVPARPDATVAAWGADMAANPGAMGDVFAYSVPGGYSRSSVSARTTTPDASMTGWTSLADPQNVNSRNLNRGTGFLSQAVAPEAPIQGWGTNSQGRTNNDFAAGPGSWVDGKFSWLNPQRTDPGGRPIPRQWSY